MKSSLTLALLLACSAPAAVFAQAALPQKPAQNFVKTAASSRPLPADVVVAQGEVELTLTDIDARMSRIPPDNRANFINDPDRIETMLRNLLMSRQLAHEAEELGLHNDPVVAADIAIARDEILAKRRSTLVARDLVMPSFDTLAKERYLASPDKYRSPDMIAVRHILIERDIHGDEGARRKAEEVLAEIQAKGGNFQDYVEKYSDEPPPKEGSEHGAERGLIKEIMRGDTTNDFEDAAFALKKVGDMTGVVRSKFGYHIIRLETLVPSQRFEFEKVKPQIVDELRTEFIARKRQEFIDKSRSIAVDANPELIRSLRTRYLPGAEGTVAIRRYDSAVAAEDIKTEGKDAAQPDAD